VVSASPTHQALALAPWRQLLPASATSPTSS
jgi:hypothetical protein